MQPNERLTALFWHKSRKSWVEITAQDAHNRANASHADLSLLVQLGYASTRLTRTTWNTYIRTWAITEQGMQIARKEP